MISTCVVNNLITIIQLTVLSATNSNTSLQSNNPLPEFIRIKICEQRRAEALYQRIRLSSHNKYYKILANSLKKMITKNKTKDFESHLTNFSPKDGSL